MLVRTVSRNADGTARDRPTIAISLELTRGDAVAAVRMAEDLDARGYLPPDPPMTPAEFAAAKAGEGRGLMRKPDAYLKSTSRHWLVVWDVCGRGIPLRLAIERHGLAPSTRRELQRLVKALGWATADDP